MGTPQVRWREMHQSGRPSTMDRMRFSPHEGIQFTSPMALSAPLRRPAASMLMNHWGVVRKMTGDLWRQQWG